jgi:Tfp pilus assembly protein PilO
MKLPKNYFENLSPAKYREYLKLLPVVRSENTKLLTMLIMTFAAMSFFGIFAINPTLITVVSLRKDLADSTMAKEQLVKKKESLSLLQEKYNNLAPDLPFIYEAIPQHASAPLLTAQIEALARRQNLNLSSIRVNEVQLDEEGKTSPAGSSFVFFLEASGTYEQLMEFSTSLTKINRIVTLESISLSKDDETSNLLLTIQGRGYFLQ